MSSSRAVSAGGSEVTDSSIDHIIHELLSQAEVEVENSVRNIEEARFPQPSHLQEEEQREPETNQRRRASRVEDYPSSAPAPAPTLAPKGEEEEDRLRRERLAPSPSNQRPEVEDVLTPVEGEHSFTPSFAQESSVWYEAQRYDHRSDLEDGASERGGCHSFAEAEMSDATYVSETESEISLKSSTARHKRHGRHSSRYVASVDAVKSLQNRLVHAMRKESKLQIKAEMARTEVEVLKGHLSQSETKAKRLEKTCKHLEGKIKQLKAQDTYVQCKKLQASLAKSTELNSKLVHKIQTLKLELRKEKARRHHAESTAKLSLSGRHVPLDVMDSMESLETFKADQTFDDISMKSKNNNVRYFNTQDKGFEVSELRNQVRHLKGALEQAEAANSAILSHIQEDSPRVYTGASASQPGQDAYCDDDDNDDGNHHGQSNKSSSQVINLHNFLSKPVIAEVRSSLAELKSSLTDSRGFEDYKSSYLGDPFSSEDIHGGQYEGGEEAGISQVEEQPGVKLHYASQIPPQNMDKAALKEAREAYQQEVRRMRQLFLSRLSVESASGSPTKSKG